MKKVLLGIFTLLVFSFSLTAQEDPGKALKKAARALSAFNLDPANNIEKLAEAKEMIEVAVTGEEEKNEAKTWQTKGEIYATAVGQDLGMTVVDPTYKVTDVSGALTANEAFMTAAKKAEKKYETKEAMDGLRSNISNLSNIGIVEYKAGNFKNAFANFNAVLDAHKMLKDAGQDSPLDADGEYDNALYLAALGASSAEDKMTAGKYFDQLAEREYKDAAVYDGIYKANIDDNPEKAIAALEKGRKMFPDNTSLLFTEINYYLRENKLDELTGKLKTAIAAEPDNVTLYSTLGNVYDNLFQRENAAGNVEKEKEYFDLALDYYQQALKIDPDYSDATYSIGALYYNKAAAMTIELQALADDYSKAGMAKYKSKQDEVKGYFNQALPYFKSVEKANPNDVNTLIALKEIFAKTDQLQLSGEFKTRLENAQSADNKNTDSYFEKN